MTEPKQKSENGLVPFFMGCLVTALTLQCLIPWMMTVPFVAKHMGVVIPTSLMGYSDNELTDGITIVQKGGGYNIVWRDGGQKVLTHDCSYSLASKTSDGTVVPVEPGTKACKAFRSAERYLNDCPAQVTELEEKRRLEKLACNGRITVANEDERKQKQWKREAQHERDVFETSWQNCEAKLTKLTKEKK
jgi:hypothetical protein